MAYSLPMPSDLHGWVIKIYDKERLEEPHFTVVNGECTWRVSLRTGKVMDEAQPGCKLHKRVKKLLADKATWNLLVDEWNKAYSNNPAPEWDDEE